MCPFHAGLLSRIFYKLELAFLLLLYLCDGKGKERKWLDRGLFPLKVTLHNEVLKLKTILVAFIARRI